MPTTHHKRKTPQKRGAPKSKLLKKLGYKKAGLGFIVIGIILGMTSSYIFWQEVVSADSAHGWAYVGAASQYEHPQADISKTKQSRVIASIYACKTLQNGEEGLLGNYKVKARAVVLHNSMTKNFGNPRLEIISDTPASARYAVSEPLEATAQPGATTTTPYTEHLITGSAALYYSFNNDYQNEYGGPSLYTFGVVHTLPSC